MFHNNRSTKDRPAHVRNWFPRTLIISLVPLAPCSAYLLDNIAPLSIDESPTRQSSRLFPLPRFTTGSPVVSTPQGAVKRRGPFITLPPESRRKAGEWVWDRSLIPRWKNLRTPRFHIHGDPPIDTLRYMAVRLESSWKFLSSLFPRPDPPPFLPLKVTVFRSSRDYLAAHAGQSQSKAFSFYDPAISRIVLCTEINGLPRKDLDDAIHHEIAHAFLHCVFGRLRPLPLTEGLAMFMELDYPALSGKKDFHLQPISPDEIERFAAHIPDAPRYQRFYGRGKQSHRLKAWKAVQKWICRRRNPDADFKYDLISEKACGLGGPGSPSGAAASPSAAAPLPRQLSPPTSVHSPPGKPPFL